MKAGKFFFISLIIIVIDQASKLIVKLNMHLGQEIPLIGDLFKIHFIENKGAAFGLTVANIASILGAEMSQETSKLILSLFSIVAVFAIAYVLYKLSTHYSPLPYFVAFIFGGAMGNILDRTFYGLFFNSINNYEGGLFHGRVVDMFYFDIWRGYLPNWIPLIGGDYYALWPIFNIADAAISIGIVVILLFQNRFFKMDEVARGMRPKVQSKPNFLQKAFQGLSSKKTLSSPEPQTHKENSTEEKSPKKLDPEPKTIIQSAQKDLSPKPEEDDAGKEDDN